MSGTDTSGGIPSIRTFQMDTSGAGVLKNSVNLFRGDVNYTQQLLTLPGRQQDDGLEVSFALQYQSNIHQQSVTRNLDAPTSVVGLGWSLSLPVIRLTNPDASTPGTFRYSLVRDGIDNALVQ